MASLLNLGLSRRIPLCSLQKILLGSCSLVPAIPRLLHVLHRSLKMLSESPSQADLSGTYLTGRVPLTGRQDEPERRAVALF